jgi:hypothetical protein
MKPNDDSMVWVGTTVAVLALGVFAYLALPHNNYVTRSGQNPLRPHAGQPVSYLLVGTDLLDTTTIRGRSLRIIVPVGISRVDLDATLRQAVSDERRREPEVGEIIVFAYGPNDDTQGDYTYGKVDRTPDDRYLMEIAPGVEDRK